MTATYSTNHATIKICNSLLRGEISAVETYKQVVEKFASASSDDALKLMRDDHEDNAAALRALVQDGGMEPATAGSAAWGGFSQAIRGTSKLVGESPALQILQQGEQHSIRLYEQALADPHVTEEVKELIREEMLPVLQGHLVELQFRRGRAA